ncbi:MAG: protease SohB [Gammaproteobacteria bacterium]|nr:protease SohB [Gammaproteobacteria bacterium]
MAYVYEYLVFLAQAVTVVAAMLIVIFAAASLAAKKRSETMGHLEVTRLNDHLDSLRQCIEQAVLPAGEFKKAAKAAAKKRKQQRRQGPEENGRPGRVFALAFKGDMQASRVKGLRHEINAILSEAREGDEVVARVESPGGLAHSYGLAASQLLRVREKNLNLVVAVDKVAASGGYLMAAVANRLIAAPFAVVGSIGVVAQVPNVHRLLKKKDVDVELITAGKYKRTLTVFGENTQEGREKFTDELEDLHALFQEFVVDKRPGLDLEKVATGEAWFGQRALDLNLVDEIMTSDEYLMQRCADTDVYEIRWKEPKRPLEKMLAQVENSIGRMTGRLFGR